MGDYREQWEERKERIEGAVKKVGKIALKKGGKFVVKKVASVISLKLLLIILVLVVAVGAVFFLLSEGAEELMWERYGKFDLEKTAWSLVRADNTLRGIVKAKPKEVGFLVAIVENELGGFRMGRGKTIRVVKGGETAPVPPEYMLFVGRVERTVRKPLPLYFRFGAFLPDSVRAFRFSYPKERWDAELLFRNRNNLMVALRILNDCMKKCGGMNFRTAVCYAYSESICKGAEAMRRLKMLTTTAGIFLKGKGFLERLFD